MEQKPIVPKTKAEIEIFHLWITIRMCRQEYEKQITNADLKVNEINKIQGQLSAYRHCESEIVALLEELKWLPKDYHAK